MVDNETWRIYSCCPGKHRLTGGCLARRVEDGAGTRREIVERAGDDDHFLAVTVFPSGLKTKPWPVSREEWSALWSIVHSEVHPE